MVCTFQSQVKVIEEEPGFTYNQHYFTRGIFEAFVNLAILLKIGIIWEETTINKQLTDCTGISKALGRVQDSAQYLGC